MATTQARNIKVGDLMDLENDPKAHQLMTDIDKVSTEFDYSVVYQVEHVAGRVLIGWEGIGGLASYHEDELVTVGTETA